MANKEANRMFEDYMRRTLGQEQEKNTKVAAIGSEDNDETVDTSTEELSHLIRGFNSASNATVTSTDVNDENIQISLQEAANEERIKKENEARFLAEQKERERIEAERLAAEAAEAEEKKKKKGLFSNLFKKKAEPPETTDVPDIAMEGENTPVEAEEPEKKEAPVSKKKKEFFSKLAAPKRIKEEPVAATDKDEPAAEVKLTDKDWEYIATHDEMTETLNKKAFDLRSNDAPAVLGVMIMDINNLKYHNSRFGREKGDEIITRMCTCLKDSSPDEDIYRVDGDEFIAIFTKYEKRQLKNILSGRVNKLIYDFKKMSEKDSMLTFSASFGTYEAQENETISSAVAKARVKMERDKAEYHENHPEFSMNDNRIPEKTEEEEKELTISEEDYNKSLSREKQTLKRRVMEEHLEIPSDKVKAIIDSVQEKLLSESTHIKCIIMTSNTFNDIFLFRDSNSFIDIVQNVDYHMDFSYLYVVTREGTQYMGGDTYLDEVNTIFQNIGNAIRNNKIRTQEDFTQVEDILIFQNILSDY